MKDNLTREMVNELRDVANAYAGTQQLRDRISHVVHEYLGAEMSEDHNQHQKPTSKDSLQVEAMKMALEVLEQYDDPDLDMHFQAVNALRKAIEQAEKQELEKPVAYLDAVDNTGTVYVAPARKRWLKEHEDKAWCAFHAKHMDDIPLYTAPPQREWIGLTDEEMYQLRREGAMQLSERDFRAIEAKLREKNAYGWQSVENLTEYLDDLRGGADT